MLISEYERIRLILVRNWDPIGVKGFDSFDEQNESEYDSYARDISELISRGGSENELKRYLLWAETHIEAGTSRSRIDRVARLILSQLP
jgi:hypothetical protein